METESVGCLAARATLSEEEVENRKAQVTQQAGGCCVLVGFPLTYPPINP